MYGAGSVLVNDSGAARIFMNKSAVAHNDAGQKVFAGHSV